jgi:hypothetical protein
MRDVVILLLVTAFFAVSAAYVWWCNRIIGPDPTDPVDPGDDAAGPPGGEVAA